MTIPQGTAFVPFREAPTVLDPRNATDGVPQETEIIQGVSAIGVYPEIGPARNYSPEERPLTSAHAAN